MSMNLYVEGTRKATVTVKGKKKTFTDRTEFKLWQTPTKLTLQAMALPQNDQKVDAYVRWADSVTEDAQEHVTSLREWLRMCDDEDFSVTFYSL